MPVSMPRCLDEVGISLLVHALEMYISVGEAFGGSSFDKETVLRYDTRLSLSEPRSFIRVRAQVGARVAVWEATIKKP